MSASSLPPPPGAGTPGVAPPPGPDLPPPDPTAPIQAVGVSKWFKDVVAVSEVSFTLGRGVTALLGPNGAGKSTLLRVLCGLASPSAGYVRVLGRDPRADRDLSRHIGLVPQQETLFEHLTVLEFTVLGARLHGLDDPRGRARAAVAQVDLDPDLDRPIGTFSKGMRQRAKLAHALVHEPEVLFLDEPLAGLDPRQRVRAIELFRRLGDDGRCVLVSSHVLDEVERFGSDVLVVVQGRLAATGDFHAIRELMDNRAHRIRLRCTEARRVAASLVQSPVTTAVRLTGPDEIVVETEDVVRFRQVIAAVARNVDAHLFELDPLDEDLESVFRYLVGT